MWHHAARAPASTRSNEASAGRDSESSRPTSPARPARPAGIPGTAAHQASRASENRAAPAPRYCRRRVPSMAVHVSLRHARRRRTDDEWVPARCIGPVDVPAITLSFPAGVGDHADRLPRPPQMEARSPGARTSHEARRRCRTEGFEAGLVFRSGSPRSNMVLGQQWGHAGFQSVQAQFSQSGFGFYYELHDLINNAVVQMNRHPKPAFDFATTMRTAINFKMSLSLFILCLAYFMAILICERR